MHWILQQKLERDQSNSGYPARETASQVFELLKNQQRIKNPETLLPDAYLNLSGFVINKSFDSIEPSSVNPREKQHLKMLCALMNTSQLSISFL